MTDLPELAEPSIHPEAFVAHTASVYGAVSIEKGASIWFGVAIRAEAAPVTIGSGTNVQDNAVIHTDDGLPVVLGKDVTVGHAAIVHGATVADGALVGMGAILLNGAVVEAGALVAAGTLVPPGGLVPAGMLAVGNPMRVIREVRDSERDSTARGLLHYQHYAKIYSARAAQEGD